MELDPKNEALRRLRRAGFATEESVYGVILVSGMIVVAGAGDATSVSVLITVFATVLVFWAAHVYAGAVADHGLGDERHSLGEAVLHALRKSAGLLLSALIPCALLLLGTSRLVDDQVAIWAALGSGIVVLGGLGWIAFDRRGASIAGRVGGSLMTAAFGVLMALLKAFVVH